LHFHLHFNTQEKKDTNATSGSLRRSTKTINSNKNLMNIKVSPVSLDEKSIDLDVDEHLVNLEKSPANLSCICIIFLLCIAN
jgi:hypothetical protein